MTISSETTLISYPGNGVQTAFTYNFLIPRNSDGSAAGLVALVDSSGATSFLNPTSYTISGVGNPLGGVVIFPLIGPPVDSSSKLIILRNAAYEQLTAVSNNAFYPHTLEQMADYMTMLLQQLNERAGRTVSAPPGENMGFLPSAHMRAGLFLSFDANGNPIAVSGTGGGGGSAWASLEGVPDIITAFDSLTPAAGMIVEYTSPTSAHLIPTPSGGGVSGVSSVNGRTGAVVLDAGDVANGFGAETFASLAAGANVTLAFNAGTGITTVAASGGGGSGNMQPKLLSDFHAIDGGGVNTASNDLAFAAAEAAGDTAIYIPDGIYATTRAESAFNKYYVGRGTILFPGAANDKLPANYSYLAAKQPGAGGTGRTGWFVGSKFVEQEYKVIGPNVRTFDTAAVYYDSTTIPQNSWMDTFSGSSGAQALLLLGANPGMGTRIPLSQPADASWVGQTVAFNNSYGGAAVETKTVTAVNTGGNNFDINSPLANTYTWNPGAGFAPTIYFAPRTWAGEKYLKMTAAGGGDNYGHNVRMIVNYAPKASEIHPFMAGTYSQYGGDVTAQTDGTYLQSWESQIQGNNHDIWAISFVQSMVRNVDATLASRFWGGTWIQSGGTRPIDSFHTILGQGRVGLDTVFATLEETATLTAPANATNTFVLTSTNGAHPKDPFVIGAESLIINTVVGLTVTTTTPCVNNYPSTTAVVFPKGGAALNMALNHRLLWNSSLSATGRGSDPNAVFSTPYGNKQGDLIMESGNDGASTAFDYWVVRFADGGSNATPDSSRIRLRRGGIQFFGTGAHSFAGTGVNLGAGCNLSIATGSLAIMGTGCYFFSDGSHIYATSPSGTVTII